MFLHEILQTMLKPLPTTLATSKLINYLKVLHLKPHIS